MSNHFESQQALTREYAPTSLNLADQNVMDDVVETFKTDELMKAAQQVNPMGYGLKKRSSGMVSTDMDDLQVNKQNGWFERRDGINFDMLRSVVDQTPILNAVVLTRVRQVSRFTRRLEGKTGVGFEIVHRDRDHKITQDELKETALISDFFTNCGWEKDPRIRSSLKRDNFHTFMSKLVRDSLTMDSTAIETEFKTDKGLGMEGIYAVDGATIRLCSEQGYEGNEEIFALQVIQQQVRTLYGYEDLIYIPRNPRSDVLVGGYGLGEVELMVRVVTGFLNAMTYNIDGFDKNSIPKGMLHLCGQYDTNDLNSFKRQWNAMVQGVNNRWVLPVMVSQDQDSKASFENFGNEFNEMYFSKWMSFLVSIICAIYGISPDEINFDSFSSDRSSLSGNDTSEKLASSKDKGLRPLLKYFEEIFTDYVCSVFSDKYMFRWAGLDPEDEEKRYESRKLILTIDEMRAEEGYGAIGGLLGEAPINPSLLGVWQQLKMAEEPEDFGQSEQSPQSDQETGENANNQEESEDDHGENEEKQNANTSEDSPEDEQGEEEKRSEDEPDNRKTLNQNKTPAKLFEKSLILPTVYKIGY